MTEAAVVDCSAVVFACTELSDQAEALSVRLSRTHCHAPHLVDAEVGNVMRRHLLAGKVDEDTALSTLRVTKSLIDYRYDQSGGLSEVAWHLRGSIAFYDALYVALAARLDVPLLTADKRLARAPQLPCEVEVVG